MTKTTKDESSDEVFPSEVRCPVIGRNQFQLPARLVREVGFRSQRWDTVRSAKVAWYYHEEDEKAVLANNTIERPSLELVGASALSGVSNDELESDDVSSARVTIISDLPNALYERLTTDRLVLKPLYATHHPQLNGTCVSVYPAGEYDCGTLPNVTHDQILAAGNEASTNDTSDVVGTYHNHANSV
ncbi:hypothetical protein [Haloarchaeobius salinus]|uniref:hypothetical protein n=1 Tax=Haloarchaeobius salinus TaxID=1198298 RepID=UPI00210D29D8|nr:hypothetical protein [Haloarchaeobius salinus]